MFRREIHIAADWLEALVLTGLGVLLLGLLAPQVWTFQGSIPITPQSLLVVLWGVLWGWQIGTASVFAYLVLGGLGAPVFADGASGWIHFQGSTAGFLFAFPIAALVTGWLAEQVTKMRYGASALLLLMGQGIVVALGLVWQRAIIPVESAWTETVLNLLPAIMVKTALGSLVVVFVGRMLTGHRRHGGDRERHVH